MSVAPSQSIVLGKRKHLIDNDLVLRLTSPSNDELSDGGTASTHENQTSIAGPSIKHMLVNGSLVPISKRRYRCSAHGCSKAYTKPSRLEEHERSHTGDRPFVCTSCKKSYLRETHLHAHARTHLPQASRPFACERQNCSKRFWTAQHLKVHHSWHDGAKPYKCQEDGCIEAFAKHSQLRAHVCSAHRPPGTKPYPCDHPQCSKSFDTNQHLKAHQKTHDEKRYTCVHPACLSPASSEQQFYPTWTALQAHMKKAHPPTCNYPSCNGKTFANAANLRSHLKLHDEREVELVLGGAGDGDAHSEDEGPNRKRRRGGDHGRDWPCEHPGCDKDFKSKKALNTHTNVTHLGRRDFACDHPRCGRAFGYKHLLQRHQNKFHAVDVDRDSSSDDSDIDDKDAYNVDDITGHTYAAKSVQLLASDRAVQCPYPQLHGLPNSADGTHGHASRCQYIFTRAYDLRRHLAAIHDITIEKQVVEHWVKQKRKVL